MRVAGWGWGLLGAVVAAGACGGTTSWQLKGSGYTVVSPVASQVMEDETRIIHTGGGRARFNYLRMKSTPHDTTFVAISVRWCNKPIIGTNKERAKAFFEGESEGQRHIDLWNAQGTPKDAGGRTIQTKVEWPENGVIVMSTITEPGTEASGDLADDFFASLEKDSAGPAACE